MHGLKSTNHPGLYKSGKSGDDEFQQFAGIAQAVGKTDGETEARDTLALASERKGSQPQPDDTFNRLGTPRTARPGFMARVSHRAPRPS
jgi:hypothetical protein